MKNKTLEDISRQEIMEVGQELAITWGAVCLDYTINNDEVVFSCQEFDEEFSTAISIKELLERINGTYKEPTLEELKQQAII